MTVAAVAIAAAAVVSVAGSVVASQQAAEGAENAEATMAGGVARLTAFRQQLKTDNQVYKDWQEGVTRQLVDDVSRPPLESQAYKDAVRRFTTARAATGSIRSGGSDQGLRELAIAESDAQINRRLAVDQLLQNQTQRSDALRAQTYNAEASLLGGQANAQMEEANAKAAGTQGAAQGISSALSGAAGAYYGGGTGSMLTGLGPDKPKEPNDPSRLNGNAYNGAYVASGPPPDQAQINNELYGVYDPYARR